MLGLRNSNESKILAIQKKKNCELYFAPLSPANVPPCPLRPLWFIFTSQ